MNDEVGSRLRQSRKAAGLTQQAVAKTIGVTFGAASQWEQGITMPNGSNLLALAKLYRVRPGWITAGQDSSDEAEWAGSFDPWDSETPLGDDEVELPLFREVEIAAGVGTYAVEENHGNVLRFAKSSLRRAGVDAAAAGCAFVVGDSMEPVLPDGACVGIDTANTSVKDGDMYALDHGGLLRVKRLYRVPGGGIRASSINPDYPDEIITPEQMQDGFRIIGRVFWYSAMI